MCIVIVIETQAWRKKKENFLSIYKFYIFVSDSIFFVFPFVQLNDETVPSTQKKERKKEI